MRIKQIIVISDDDIREQADIQRQLKGTDPVFLRIGRHGFTGKAVLLCNQGIDCRIDAVIVSLRPLAAVWVAVRLVQDTHLFPGC